MLLATALALLQLWDSVQPWDSAIHLRAAPQAFGFGEYGEL